MTDFQSDQATAGAILEESARYEAEKENDPYLRDSNARRTFQNSYADSPGRNENKF